MPYREVLNQLEGLGTTQIQELYRKQGSGSNTYGVSLANLKKMAKGIGIDHELALALWSTDNIDAQMLATLIADPGRLNLSQAHEMLSSINFSKLIHMFAQLIAKTAFAHKAMNKWLMAKNEHVKQAGEELSAILLKNQKRSA